MRIWLDRKRLAARQLTVNDVEDALRRENVELPAGQVQSKMRDFTVRVDRVYNSAEDFANLVIAEGDDGYLIRLSDIGNVEIAPVEERGFFRGNGVSMVGIGVIKQSTANTLDVANRVKKKMQQINEQLPAGMIIEQSYDTSIFIQSSINEVYKTLFIAIGLVIVVIYLFLGNARAMLIPAVTVPVSLISTFIVLWALGYTLNLLTLLALVLAIGLVVDDAIVVLENIHRRIELGEPALLAAYRGTRQVGFAVIATTMVLVAVFIPITFLEGDVGRLFSEFAMALAAAVLFSSFVALTLSSVMASKLMGSRMSLLSITKGFDQCIQWLQNGYVGLLHYCVHKRKTLLISFLLILCACTFCLQKLPSEFVPKEDRGVIFLLVSGPEGASFEYTEGYLNQIEQRLMPFVESEEFHRLLVRSPRSLSGGQDFSGGIGIIVLKDWDTGRKPIDYYVGEIRRLTQDIAGVRVFPIVRQGLVRGLSKPVEFVLGGATFEELAQWRNIILEETKNNPKLLAVDHDYKETKPQLAVTIDKNRAGDLGVSLIEVNRTLESLLGSRRVTTYIERGEEYDVIIEGISDLQKSLLDLKNIYVRSTQSNELIPLVSLVSIREFAAPTTLNRYNRLRSITIEASLAEDYSLGEALAYLEDIAKNKLPPGVSVNYKGESLDFKESGTSVYQIFILSILVVFLVMAGLFESFIHPFVILFSVPLAVFGALLGLLLTGQSINLYSQIGLIMLVGLAAKNGILIVEFINQLRDQGEDVYNAVIKAAQIRFRPILMTALTTVMGALPLIFSYGAGAETRYVLGVVIIFGVSIMTIFTLLYVPIAYLILAQRTSSPDKVKDALIAQEKEIPDNI